ncbi:MAG: DUF350 domain-containing protein [Pseudomonadota bacterium]
MAALEAFQAGLPDFLLHTGMAFAMLVLGSAVYIKLTPWRELALVKDKNGSAGLALAGAIIGLAIPISACLANALNWVGFLIWGTVALLMQLIAYRVTDFLLRDLPRRIQEDEAGAAIFLIGTKIASALILATGLWDPNLYGR